MQEVGGLVLLSALMLVKLVKESLLSNFMLDLPTCYTDSQVALYWIIGEDKEWKQFVQNRIAEICGLLLLEHWRKLWH